MQRTRMRSAEKKTFAAKVCAWLRAVGARAILRDFHRPGLFPNDDDHTSLERAMLGDDREDPIAVSSDRRPARQRFQQRQAASPCPAAFAAIAAASQWPAASPYAAMAAEKTSHPDFEGGKRLHYGIL